MGVGRREKINSYYHSGGYLAHRETSSDTYIYIYIHIVAAQLLISISYTIQNHLSIKI